MKSTKTHKQSAILQKNRKQQSGSISNNNNNTNKLRSYKKKKDKQANNNNNKKHTKKESQVNKHEYKKGDMELRGKSKHTDTQRTSVLSNYHHHKKPDSRRFRTETNLKSSKDDRRQLITLLIKHTYTHTK